MARVDTSVPVSARIWNYWMGGSDYYPVDFTDPQWAALRRAFPGGVCDWSKPGVSQQDTIPWQTYQQPDGKVIYGGEPLGRAPSGSGGGWTSGAFSSWRRASG